MRAQRLTARRHRPPPALSGRPLACSVQTLPRKAAKAKVLPLRGYTRQGNLEFEITLPEPLPDANLVHWAYPPILFDREPCHRTISFHIRHTFMLVLDAWGNDSLAKAGVCANLPHETCLDTDPCTKDLCDPKLGCIHPPFPDGAFCSAKGTCQAGKCVEGKAP